MSISFSLPQEIEAELRHELGNLDEIARDAFLIENYRAGRLSVGDLAAALGFATKYEAEEWLGQHGVTWNYGISEFEADRQTLSSVLGTTA